MDNLTPLQQHVLAFYLAHSAKDFAMSGRWFPYGELELIFADKVKVDVRPFGKAAQDAAKAVATFYLDHMIAQGGFANKDQKFGGTMHQYEGEGFGAALDALKADNAILQQAQAAGDGFWEAQFAELTN